VLTLPKALTLPEALALSKALMLPKALFSQFYKTLHESFEPCVQINSAL
jgi:hypothetical protein